MDLNMTLDCMFVLQVLIHYGFTCMMKGWQDLQLKSIAQSPRKKAIDLCT